jgi:fructose/tagatose bisphosphate aldolase
MQDNQEGIMLAALHTLLTEAHAGAWALGAFNTYNLEITEAIVSGAENLRAPVLVQTDVGAQQGTAGTALPALILVLARVATVPVVLHLDLYRPMNLYGSPRARSAPAARASSHATPVLAPDRAL